jgi:hypothetical protein
MIFQTEIQDGVVDETLKLLITYRYMEWDRYCKSTIGPKTWEFGNRCHPSVQGRKNLLLSVTSSILSFYFHLSFCYLQFIFTIKPVIICTCIICYSTAERCIPTLNYCLRLPKKNPSSHCHDLP